MTADDIHAFGKPPPPAPAAATRRLRWPWVLGALLLCLVLTAAVCMAALVTLLQEAGQAIHVTVDGQRWDLAGAIDLDQGLLVVLALMAVLMTVLVLVPLCVMLGLGAAALGVGLALLVLLLAVAALLSPLWLVLLLLWLALRRPAARRATA